MFEATERPRRKRLSWESRCEIVAMISSFGAALLFLILAKNGVTVGFSQQLMIGIGVTTICWLATAYLGPKNDEAVLLSFYRKVHPFGPGWRPIRAIAGVPAAEAALEAEHQNSPLSMVGWIMGCTMIWSALFTVGNFLYGRTNYALALGAVFVVSGLIVIRVVQRLWN